MDDFVELLWRYNEGCATGFGHSHVAVNTIKKKLHMFIWIRDEEECVFCVSPEGDQSMLEINFRTWDKSLIDQFVNVYQMYKRLSTETPVRGIP